MKVLLLLAPLLGPIMRYFTFSAFLVLISAESILYTEPITSLSDANTSQLRNNLDKEWIIMFYADWCGACKVIKPYFHQMASWSKRNRPDIIVAAANYADSPILLTRFGITQLPTIFHIKNNEFRDVSTERGRLESLLEGESWKEIPPIKSWLAPFSLVGNAFAAVGYFGYLLMELLGKFQTFPKEKVLLIITSLVIGIVLLFVTLTFLENSIIRRNKRRQQEHVNDNDAKIKDQ